MIAILAVLLAVGGLVGYFVAVTRFAYWRSVPWPFIAITAAGALLGTVALLASPRPGTAIAALASIGVLVFCLWFFLRYSQYGPREDRPRTGDPFPDFTLVDSTGVQFQLSQMCGKRVLFLFYRGDW